MQCPWVDKIVQRRRTALNETYATRRSSSPLLAYGLRRRTETVADLLSKINSIEYGRVLDVGTADGAMIEAIQPRFPKASFVGLERDRRLCEVACSRGVRAIQGDVRSLPFREGEIDVVVMSATLKHVRGYEQALRECARILTVGGHLVVLDPTPLGIWMGVRMGHFDLRGSTMCGRLTKPGDASRAKDFGSSRSLATCCRRSDFRARSSSRAS